jgi:hypothetical protein
LSHSIIKYKKVIFTLKDRWKWQRGIEGKIYVIYLQKAEEHVRYVEEQELNYYTHIKQTQSKTSKFVKTVAKSDFKIF